MAVEAAQAGQTRAQRAQPLLSVKAKQTSGWSAALLVITVVSLIPVFWIVMLSLKTGASVTDGSLIPHHWTLSNYKDIFNAGIFTDPSNDEYKQSLIDMTPIGRLGTPQDVAAITAFLASGDAGLITGQQIVADGGMH